MRTLMKAMVILALAVSIDNAFADQPGCTMICQTINGYTYCHQICVA